MIKNLIRNSSCRMISDTVFESVFNENTENKLYIYLTSSMIYVSKITYDEIKSDVDSERLFNDEYEVYDTTDNDFYFERSEYSDYVKLSYYYLSRTVL